MTIKFQYTIALVVLFAGIQSTYSQKKDENIGSEVINVVKPYTPTISDAFKVKETPTFEDEETTKKEAIQYNIFSFPVASTFTPSKGKAAGVEKGKQEKTYNNYASLGIGNYGTAIGELFITENLNRNEYVGGMFRHNSSQGGIKDVSLDDYFYDSRLDLTYGNQQQSYSWNVDLGYRNQVYNWYGVPQDLFQAPLLADLDVKQAYNTLYVGGKINTKESVFSQAEVLYKRFWDGSDSAENRFYVKPTFEFDFLGEKVKTDFIVDYVGGSFDKGFASPEKINYGFANFGFQPSFVLVKEDFAFKIGAGIFYSVNNETSDNKLYFYPQVTASYKVVGDLMIAYAGAEGTLKQNSYADFVGQNQFLSPTLAVAPTDQQYDLYVGLKGKLASNVAYNVRGSVMNEKSKALFTSNPYSDTNVDASYKYGNSFGVTYDNVRTISIFGELKMDISNSFAFGINGTYNNYTTDNEFRAWNLPELKLGANLDFKITDKWFAGANVFYVGERDDQLQLTTALVPTNTVVTLKSYFDANLNVGYNYTDRLSFYLKGNNLANSAYQKWLNYPVQQIQVVVGASYKFDF